MDPRVTGASPINPLSSRNLEKAVRQELLQQIESEADLEQWCETEAFNPLAMMRNFRLLSEMKQGKQETTEEKKLEEVKIKGIEEIQESATKFQSKNPELQAKTLLILRSRIMASDTPEEALKKVLEVYPDPALADEALDFLIENADSDTLATLQAAKVLLIRDRDREIKAGRNMGAASREFSKEGLGSPTQLRDLYREITGTPREPLKLFEELTSKYPYSKLRTIIHFLLHSLGSDLRAKGPSIPRGELKRLVDETRSLQGILGVYRFFNSRMGLIERQFASYDIEMPPRLDFDTLAKQFVKFLAERFMSPDKILQAAKLMGISEEAMAQIIVFTQMRDAIKQIAPRYYRTPQQREDLLKSFIKAIEQLEDTLEKEEEKQQQKQKKREERDKKRRDRK